MDRNSLLWFADEMEKVLAANEHKGGWSACTMEYLLGRLEQESAELSEAVCGFEIAPARRAEALEKIVREAIDVANFAMMIADNARKAQGGQPFPPDRKTITEDGKVVFSFGAGRHSITGAARTEAKAKENYIAEWNRLLQRQPADPPELVFEIKTRAGSAFNSVRQTFREPTPIEFGRRLEIRDNLFSFLTSVQAVILTELDRISQPPKTDSDFRDLVKFAATGKDGEAE